MGSKDDELRTDTAERMGSMATAKASAMKHKISGGGTELGGEYSVDPNDLEALVATWPAAPRKTAEKMLEFYGPPNEATPTKLFWYRAGPWRRIVLTSDEVVHNFPTPHTDFLTQYIDYRVPEDKVADLWRFDGSVLVDRTAGEVGARCDAEAYNTLTLNLVHEIVTGARTVDDARELYAETASAFVTGRPAPYAEGLLFEPPTEGTADPDDKMIGAAMTEQMAEKVKDVLSGRGSGVPPI